MTIAAKLLTVNGIKTDIKTALEIKGVDMTDVKFSEYAGLISGINIGSITLIQRTNLTTTDASSSFELSLALPV